MVDTSSKCFQCEHKLSIPGDCHIKCVEPDPDMTGDKYGASQGWFNYPYNFDPTWMAKECSNFKPKQ